MAQSLSQIRELLEQRGLAPRKRLGQNFLIDQNLVRRLVAESGAAPGDLVLEVGPGTGTLTEELLARGCSVVACELDPGLAALLRERSAALADRLALVEGDCLEGKHALSPALLNVLGGKPFKLVANLPYNAATPLIMNLLTSHPECSTLAVTIQREVADRILALPGSPDYGPLSAMTFAAAESRRIALLPPECFWPRPDVTSAMVLLTRRDAPLAEDLPGLAAFLASIFTRRRKQIGALLGGSFPFPPGIARTDRAEALSVEALIELHRASKSV